MIDEKDRNSDKRKGFVDKVMMLLPGAYEGKKENELRAIQPPVSEGTEEVKTPRQLVDDILGGDIYDDLVSLNRADVNKMNKTISEINDTDRKKEVVDALIEWTNLDITRAVEEK